jgi:hypothetical protein
MLTAALAMMLRVMAVLDPYKTFHKGYTEASSDDIIDLTGTFTWTDAAE